MIVPETITLEMPPGDPGALEDLVREVAGVGHLLAVLASDLAGPEAGAQGWIGDDASAAAAQVGAVVSLSRDMSGAVLMATARLSAHADRLGTVRREIEALRRQQHEDHLSTWQRLHLLPGNPGRAGFEDPVAIAIIEEFCSGEELRRRRHGALLAAVDDDAAVAAQALGEAGAVVGGTGRRGDDGRVLAHLATRLPAWGEAELAARGHAVAARLADFEGTPELDGMPGEMADAARGALPYAGIGAFANAFVAELGVDGVRDLLTALGTSANPQESPVAALLAAALGGVVPGDSVHDAAGPVVNAQYVSGRHRSVDLTVAGMVAVLAAGSRPASRGLRPATVAGWARQLLHLEQSEGRRVGVPVVHDWPDGLSDPVAAAMGVLANSGEPEAVAGLLLYPDMWRVALARWWQDGGAAFAELVQCLRHDVGSTGGRAARAGLEAIGAGLTLGDPSDRGVRRGTVDAISPALAAAVAVHLPVAVDVLSVGVDGRLGAREAALRGLGYLTAGPGGTAGLEGALLDWARRQPVDLRGTSSAAPLPAVAIPGAYLAVREYGQRLAHALDGFEAKEFAGALETFWDWTFGLPTTLAGELGRRSWPGTLLGLVEGYAAILLGMDGTWENPVDRGLRFDGADAVEATRDLGQISGEADALARQAEAAFDRTATALGEPVAPRSPDVDLLGPLGGAAADAASGRPRERVGAAVRDAAFPDAAVGGPHDSGPWAARSPIR